MVSLAWSLWLGCGPERPVLQVKGSDTLVNLMVRLSENYAADPRRPAVAVSGGGTGTGLAAITDGTTDFASASREIKPRESSTAAARGRRPIGTVIAHDGLSIYVNRDNPVAGLTVADLRCIYAKGGACRRWSDLGVTLDCRGSDEIVRIGRQNNSGTYEYFREIVLGNDGYFASTMDQSGTQQVVDVIGTVPCAIGYGGMGYATEQARFVCLARAPGEPCVEPTIEAVTRRAYPFSRPLYLYSDGEPTGDRRDFLAWVLGPAGQRLVLDAGFVPVAAP